MLVALGLPRPPHRRLLLADADQHHLALTTLGCSRLKERTGELFFVLTLLEAHHRHAVLDGEPFDLFDQPVTDCSERRRRRDLEPFCWAPGSLSTRGCRG